MRARSGESEPMGFEIGGKASVTLRWRGFCWLIMSEVKDLLLKGQAPSGARDQGSPTIII